MSEKEAKMSSSIPGPEIWTTFKALILHVCITISGPWGHLHFWLPLPRPLWLPPPCLQPRIPCQPPGALSPCPSEASAEPLSGCPQPCSAASAPGCAHHRPMSPSPQSHPVPGAGTILGSLVPTQLLCFAMSHGKTPALAGSWQSGCFCWNSASPFLRAFFLVLSQICEYIWAD